MESRQRQFEMALQTINKFYNDLSDTERKKIMDDYASKI